MIITDPHAIVERIRSILHARELARAGRLAAVATVYAGSCHEAMQRLGRCHRLLQKGLRSEAIQLAESEPNLLDALAALDFPERAEWDDLVDLHDLEPAPQLPIDPARLLKRAYAEENPLQDLLRRHRRLALQRAPLRNRIAVLRQLAAQDPGNPIWADEQRAFERVRLLQVQDEATEAVRHHDAEAIARLVAEVEQPGWAEPPSRALIEALGKADADLRGEQARAVLADVATRLVEAHNTRDSIRGRLARREWAKLVATAVLASHDPIAERAQPALDWLDDEDCRDQDARQHEAAVTALVRALDNPGFLPPGKLERLAREVTRLGRRMSDGLQQRYISRLHAAEALQSRRFTIKAVASGTALFLAGTLIYYVVHSRARASEAEQVATAIGDMLELGEIEHAAEILKDLETKDPTLLTYARMIDVRQRVEVARNQEAERALQFDQALRAAEAAPVAAKAPPALETARSLARLVTEKEALGHLEKRRAAALQAEQVRREKELDPRLAEIERTLERLEQQAGSVPPGGAAETPVLGKLIELGHTLAQLGPDLALAAEAVQARARSLGQRINAVRARRDQRQQQARLEDAITAAVVNAPASGGFPRAAEFANALQTYVKTFPDTPRARAITLTLREQPLWDALAAWDRLTAGWKGGGLSIAPQEAKIRAELCRQFLVQHPGSPDADRAGTYQRAMETIARRGADADGALTKLQRLLTDILVDNLWMVIVKPPGGDRPRRYYLPQKPARNARSIRYLAEFDGKGRTATVIADWIQWSGVAPQSQVAAEFKPIFLQDARRIDWETATLDLVERIRSQPGMDPVLRVALLRKVLELALEGSEPLREALGGFKSLVDQADVDVYVPWMDPESDEAALMRTKAAAVLRSLPDPAPLRKDALQRRARIERLIARRPRPVGWLAHEADGWRVRTGSVLPSQGSLWVILPGEGGRGTWQQVGAIDHAKPKLSVADDPALAEGRPVFARSPEEDRS